MLYVVRRHTTLKIHTSTTELATWQEPGNYAKHAGLMYTVAVRRKEAMESPTESADTGVLTPAGDEVIKGVMNKQGLHIRDLLEAHYLGCGNLRDHMNLQIEVIHLIERASTELETNDDDE